MMFLWGTPVMIAGNLKCHDFTLEEFADLYEVTVGEEEYMMYKYVPGGPKAVSSPGTWQISYYPRSPWYWKWASWYVSYVFSKKPKEKARILSLGAKWSDKRSCSFWPTISLFKRV